GRAQGLVLDRLLAGLPDGFLDDLAHDLLAEGLAQVADRHLAGAEAFEAHLALHLIELGAKLRFQILRGDLNLQFALQTVRVRNRDLHRPSRSFSAFPSAVLPAWCGRRDSNPHALRHWNLNPARLPIPPRPQEGLWRSLFKASLSLIWRTLYQGH